MRFPFAQIILPGCLALLLACGVMAQSQPTITISPPAGQVERAVFDIRIRGLNPGSEYIIEIVYAGAVVFSSRETSDANGEISYPVSSSAGDGPGIYTLRALSRDQVIASANFELTAASQISVNPASARIGEIQRIRIEDLDPQAAFRLEISASETGQVAYSREHSSDATGVIDIEIISEAGDAPGHHAITLYDQTGALIAEGHFRLETPMTDALAVSLQPATLPAGQSVEISLSGLAAFASVTAQITSSEGVLIDTLLARASGDGALKLTFESARTLPAGEYSVAIFVEAEKRSSATLSVTEPVDAAPEPIQSAIPEPTTPAAAQMASVTIEPQTAPIGASHLVAIRGLAAHEAITLDVSFDGRSVYQTAKTADDQGRVDIELVTDSSDASGNYVVTVLREAGNQPSLTLTATAGLAVELERASLGLADSMQSRLVDGAAEFAFAGAAGQVLLISLASDDFDPALALLDQEDESIAFNDDSRGQNDAAIGPLALPYSGRYRLEVSAKPLMMAQGAIDGEFELTITEIRLESLEFDTGLAFSLGDGSPARYYALPVETGDSLSVTLDSGGQLDTLLQVIAPDGSELAFDDDSGSGLDAELSNLIFDREATYVLGVSSFDSEASGSGSLSIRRNPVQALDDGAARVTLNDKAIRDLVVFDASEDEHLILNLQKLKGHVEDLYVTATVEGMEVMSYSTMGVPEDLPLAFVMPMSGRVVVTLEKFGYDDSITLAVSLERPQ